MTEATSRLALGIAGLHAGHWTGVNTGVTVVLAPSGTVGAADVRGSAPATRELALLDVTKSVHRVDALVLTGGSAYGLATADGVMEHLAARGQGFATAAGPVPIVCAAALFDLGVSGGMTPRAEHGASAARTAARGHSVATGLVGAGAGATVGKWRGVDHAVRGGLGAATGRAGAAKVAVLAAVNAFGDVVSATGDVLAGSTAPGESAPIATSDAFSAAEGQSTTLVVVATDASLDRVGCRLVSEGAHDGLARALRPAHTRADGDVTFTLATGSARVGPVDELRLVVPDLVADAIRSSVRPPSDQGDT